MPGDLASRLLTTGCERLENVCRLAGEDLGLHWVVETLQHVVGGILRAGRSTNPDPEPPEGLAPERINNRPDAVVAAAAPAVVHPHLAEGQIDVVVSHQQPARFEVANQRTNRATGLVHERGWDGQPDFDVATEAICHLHRNAAWARPKVGAYLVCQDSHGVGPNVVPGALVLGTRILQPYEHQSAISLLRL